MRPSPPPEPSDYSSKETPPPPSPTTRPSPSPRPLIGLDAEGRLAQASYMMPLDDSTCEDGPGPEKVCTVYVCVCISGVVLVGGDSNS